MTGNRLSRRQQRIYAMQALYAWEIYPDQEITLLTFSWVEKLLDGEFPQYSYDLVKGVLAHLDEIDLQLTAVLKSWTLDRLQRVDRAILRMGAYTLLYAQDLPVAIVINESVEIAKRFSGGDSPAFVNGILDAIAQKKERDAPED